MRAVSHCVVGLPPSSLSACITHTWTSFDHQWSYISTPRTSTPGQVATELVVGLTAVIDTLWI